MALSMQAHSNKRKNWCEFRLVLEGLSLCAALIVSSQYVMIAGDSSVDAKHKKAAYPISVKDTMLRIF
ncbi:hypothetical protein Nepgr_008088 [Nepenthes gracilis]|uniref:Uncharacterized protein n=1 Tax=Nepenthes gracilis TaxID=150966 RepID=A0AAD3S863_NEPGR|nr:hypothetical protein Nepgr_008088 [Nepenthes gracilis]